MRHNKRTETNPDLEFLLERALPTEECPHQYGYFKIGDRQHCGQFMNCVDGRGYVFDCPEGLAFNPETYRCDWPDQVPECDAEAFLGFRCPEVKSSPFFGGEIKLYRSNSDCHHYFICVNGNPRLQNCGKGNAFNELIDACDAAENVTGWWVTFNLLRSKTLTCVYVCCVLKYFLNVMRNSKLYLKYV